MICAECTERLTPDDFYPSNRSRCRECVKAAATARNRSHPDRHRAASRRWRERERLRGELLELVLRWWAARDAEGFHAAVMDAEDSLGLEPGTALDLFTRKARNT